MSSKGHTHWVYVIGHTYLMIRYGPSWKTVSCHDAKSVFIGSPWVVMTTISDTSKDDGVELIFTTSTVSHMVENAIYFDVSWTNATCKRLIIRIMWECYFTARDYSRALWLPNLLTWILHADILIWSWFYLQPLINSAGATEAVWIIILQIKRIMSIICFIGIYQYLKIFIW